MDDPGGVDGVDGICDLPDDLTDLFGRKWHVLLGVFFEELAECPFDGEEVNTGSGFTDFDRTHDIGMGDTGAVRCFPKKSCYCGLIRSQLFLQNFDGSDAMGRVFGAVDHCRATFADHILQLISGECSTGKIFAAHGPKLIAPLEGSKRAVMQSTVDAVGRIHQMRARGHMAGSLRRHGWVVGLSVTVAISCAPRAQNDGGRGRGEGHGPPSPAANAGAPDPSPFYRQLGMIAQSGPFPVVGQIRYLAGATTDSTLALITLSFANQSLTFNGDAGGQRATYTVTLDVTQGSTSVRHVEVHKQIRVASFHETQRDDESVIFQQFLSLSPGTYSLSVLVRDDGGSNSATQELSVIVPRLGSHTLSTPISVYQVKPRSRIDTVPALIANPRSTIVLGRDTLAGLYIEGYGLPASARVGVQVLNDAHVVILRDTVNLVRQGDLSSALLDFPVSSIGVGPVTVVASLAGAIDSVQAPLFLSFGDEFGITSFDDLLSYLRYFVSPTRIQALRDTPPEQRAAAWAAFWKQTDLNPSTPENEALRDYFKRIATANQRYREVGVPGWLTDRGKVYITLGEPDQAGQQFGQNATARSRAEIWVYTQYNLRLIYMNQGSGSPHLRLSPSSQSDFDKVVRRLQTQ